MSLQALLPHKVVLGCTAPCTGATAAEWLAKQGDVYYVEPRHEEHFRLHNHYASGITQTGTPTGQDPTLAGTYLLSAWG
jgi:hypothetical protein